MTVTKKRLEKIKSVASNRMRTVIVLEDIHDPHNAAAVLRTADAFGIQKICFIQRRVLPGKISGSLALAGQIKFREEARSDKTGAEFSFQRGTKFNPRKIGKTTSASANKWLDFEIFNSAEKCFAKLKRRGYYIIATVLDPKAESIFKVKLIKPKTALVFGNEHRGLSSAAIEMSDAHIYIPMQGFVQSLNLSVTAAVCMYELFRQSQKSRAKFFLSKTEKNKLIKNWQAK